MIVRVSPGSPSQWKATLSPRPASTCRSTQLYAALSWPPTNHFANGGSTSRAPVSHCFAQASRSACSSQKASRSASARSYASALTLAAVGELLRRFEPAVLVQQVGECRVAGLGHRTPPGWPALRWAVLVADPMPGVGDRSPMPATVGRPRSTSGRSIAAYGSERPGGGLHRARRYPGRPSCRAPTTVATPGRRLA